MREWNELKSLIKKQKAKPAFNKKSGSMTFSYVDKKKHKHVVWYENEKTVQTKSHLAKQYKIAGVSVYALGNESESFGKPSKRDKITVSFSLKLLTGKREARILC